MSAAPWGTQHLIRLDGSATFQDNFLPGLQRSPQGTLRYPQLDGAAGIEPAGAFAFFEAISQAELSVLERLPEEAYALVLVGKTFCGI